jgi:hypothetical protein
MIILCIHLDGNVSPNSSAIDDTAPSNPETSKHPSDDCREQSETCCTGNSRRGDETFIKVTTGKAHTSSKRRKSTFSFKLSSKEYETIAPRSNNCRLRRPWTDIFYDKFHSQSKQCALVFTYNHCSKWKSRKRGNFWWGRAVCKVDRVNCVKVWFTIADKPRPDRDVPVFVTVRGSCSHATPEDVEALQPDQPNRRFLKGEARENVGKVLKQTVDTGASLYENRLSEMDKEELGAGNTTYCQEKHIFRQALYESHKKERLHDNIFIELDLLRDAWLAALPGSRGISGFVHGIGMFPFYVIFYTEAEVLK